MYRSQHNAKIGEHNSFVTDADQVVAAIAAVAEDHDVIDTLFLLRLKLSSNSKRSCTPTSLQVQVGATGFRSDPGLST
jgi:hypothetical protein